MQDKTSRPGRGSSVDAGGAADLKSLPSFDLEMASHQMTTGPGAKNQDLEGAVSWDRASTKELQQEAAAAAMWRQRRGEEQSHSHECYKSSGMFASKEARGDAPDAHGCLGSEVLNHCKAFSGLIPA